MAGPVGLTELEVGKMLEHWVEVEAQKMRMRMKMENHMEKASVALGYSSHRECVSVEVGIHQVDQHTPVGHLVLQLVMLNHCGLQGIRNYLNVEMMGKDP